MPAPTPYIAGIIVAGGQSSRMQFRDKALMPLGGRSVIEHIIDNAKEQASPLLINVNRHPDRYKRFGLPLIPDPFGPEAGPLAGLGLFLDRLDFHHFFLDVASQEGVNDF